MIDLLRNRLLILRGKTIVEFGAGYHEAFREQIARHNRYIVTDVDLSGLPALHSSYLEIQYMNACETALADESVDFACSSMLVMHLPLEKHFSEVRRVLKRDGVYLIAVTGPEHHRELKRAGIDPGIDVQKDALLSLGARIAQEEKRFEPFVSVEERESWLKFAQPEWRGRIAELTGLTKHYLLFELQAR